VLHKEGTMNRSHYEKRAERLTAELAERADVQDLRLAISRALATTPIEEQALRRGVWTYVGAERLAGTSSARVIMILTELVMEARIEPASLRHPVMQRMIRWSVEAYFGQLGDNIVGGDRDTPADPPPPVSNS
jgi:hypothetical protein